MQKNQKPKVAIATKVKAAKLAATAVKEKFKANKPASGVTVVKTKAKTIDPAPTSEKLSCQGSKQSIIIDMLKVSQGATVAELAEATGWQKHSIQGAMSGALKKKLGLTITSAKDEKRGRVYCIDGGRQ